MRGLSENFLECLKSGFLSEIIENVKGDPDLNLEIRDAYINVYYKGNSLLKLTETGSSHQFKAQIHEKFLERTHFSLDFSESNIAQFLEAIPVLKQNIARPDKRSLEIEYEQMIIRANNFESRNNTDYFIVDRQYAINDARFDLTGIFWERAGRRRNQEVPICLMEIKFALNDEIKEIHNQLARYYESIQPHAASIADEMQTIFRQKIELGLYQNTDIGNALKTLNFSRNIDEFQFIVILVDYNPNSSKFIQENLLSLPFASQVKVFHCGFALWQKNEKLLSDYLS